MPGKTSTPARKPTSTTSVKKAVPAPSNGKTTVAHANGKTPPMTPVKARVAPLESRPVDPEQTEREITQEEIDAINEGAALAIDQAMGQANDEVDVFALSTDELEDPRAPKADAVRARILEVTSFTSEQKGSVAVVIKFMSDDLNKEFNWRIFVPEQFVSDIFVSPKDLPKEDGNNKAAQYAIGIHNRANKASIDRLRLIALSQGRSPRGFDVPETFDDYVYNLNRLLGPTQDGETVNLIVLRRPNRDTGYLEIRDVVEPELMETKPQIFKNYRRSWELDATA